MASDSRDLEGARWFQEELDEDEQFQMAVQKLINSIADVGHRVDVGILEATWMALDELEKREEQIASLLEENQRLRDHLEEIEAKADAALDVARSEDTAQSKVDVAKRITRNELVRRVGTNTPQSQVPITVGEVKERAEPDHELAWKTVDRSWNKLRAEWDCFRETTKDGAQALTTSKTAVPESLARAVQHELGRDDLANNVVGGGGEGGGPR